ncbi:DUF465 domain-containing protein [Ectothiorhodospiraceae bacterium BW-2]|nr:DUF465 domain-containing protein [Ectothiorhodospiraceae bacterium BW-2]
MELENEEIVALHQQLYELRQQHRDLDEAIYSLSHSSRADQLQLVRFKKRKLQLKEQIQRLEDRLIPDLNA